MYENLKLSFCITCKNRVSQIRQTLPVNLENNKIDSLFVEFILVDFGSTDGLKEWIGENFKQELKSGYLKYYYTEKLSSWHASIAKNTAHFYADNDILVNLDCDNYTGYRGGKFVIQQFIQSKDFKIVLHQFNQYGDGSFGRIGVLRRFFDAIGGYDESFEPMGYQDADLISRLELLGLRYVRLNDERYNQAEKNTKMQSIVNVNTSLSWKQMENRNKEKSRKNIIDGITRANNGSHGIRSGVYRTYKDLPMNTMELILEYGLCNRMRALDSAIALSEKLKVKLIVYWILNSNCNCAFDKLFKPIKEVEVINGLPGHFIGDCFFDAFLIKKMQENNIDFVECFRGKNVIVNSFSRFYSPDIFYEKFIPIEYLQSRIHAKIIPDNTIGVHIRRGDHKMSIQYSPLNLFIEVMNKEKKDVFFYLASDDKRIKEKLQIIYKDQILVGKEGDADRNSEKGIQDALVELYTLAKTKRILGSYYSSFSHTAAELGHIPEQTIYRNMETDRITKETFAKDGIPEYSPLSIVMPVYNVPAGYLQEAMDSILDQTFVDFELIIVDDGSTDDSISIVKSYNDSRIRLIQNNHDFIGSLNIGMAAARGKYIVRMDADDIMLPCRLQVQYEFMEKHLKIAVCGSWIEKFGNDERIVQLPGEHEQIVTSMLLSNPMAHPSVMIRKNVFEQLGMELYKREYPCAEDYKLWTDLALKGYHFANIPEVLLRYRCSEHQVTHTKWNTMLQSTQKIQAEYAEEIMEQIVSQEKRYMDFFNSLIDLSNEGLLPLNGLLNIVYRIYVFFLRNSLPLHSGF